MNDCCLLVSRSLKRTLVGGRLSGRRFRPNFGHLDFFGAATIRTLGRRVDCVVGC